jgi:hypothetical protein
MVSSSASASVCDLACSLRQTHSDCHVSAPTSRAAHMSMPSILHMDMSPHENYQRPVPPADAGTSRDNSLSMPADMDMGPDHSDSSMAADTVRSATPGHLILFPWPPRPEMLTERLMRAPEPGMRTSAMPRHPGTHSTCTHEACSQISSSTSPSRLDHAQLSAVDCAPAHVSSPVNLWTNSHWIRLGSPPQRLLAESPATTLRI